MLFFRYSQLDFSCFSLAYSGVIMRKNSLPSSENEVELKMDCSLRDDVMTQKEEIIEEEGEKTYQQKAGRRYNLAFL